MACPSTNALAELVVGGGRGGGDGGEAGELEAHLADCAVCRRATAVLMRSSLGTESGEGGEGSERGDRAAGTTADASSRMPWRLSVGSAGSARPARRSRLLAPGTLIGRYVVQELVGAGGMGAVYAAHDPELERRIALKLLHPRREAAPAAARAELLAEAQAMARIRHPNVVGVHDVGVQDVGEHGELVYIAMELVPGGNLRRWLDERRPWREVMEVMAAAGRGLAAAHALELVHRDFKPENVLLGPGGQVCVTDFGLAQQSGGEIEGVAGTPAYMAPEQRRGARPEPRADQYSFCLVLREALEGQRPAALAEHGEPAEQGGRPGERAEERAAASKTPRWLQRVVARGLREDPAARFPSMPALLEALRPPRRWRWAAAGAAVVAAAGIALGLLASRGGVAACGEGPASLAALWNREQRQRLGEVLGGEGGLPAAKVTALLGDVDDYARGFRARHAAACQAMRRGEHSAPLFDRQVACLDARRAALASRLQLLLGGDRQAVAHAVELLAALPPTGDCAATSALLELPPLPGDPATRQAVARATDAVARAAALRGSGKAQEALAALEAAPAMDYAPVEALRALERGLLHDDLGHPREAEGALAAAVELGLRGGAADVVADALFERAAVRQLRYADRERSDEYLAQARALHARHHGAAPLSAKVEHLLSQIYLARRDFEAAAASVARGLAVLGTGTEQGASLSGRVDRQILGEVEAKILQEQGRLEPAYARMREVHAALRGELGERHPTVGRVAAELAVLGERLGRGDEARGYFAAAEVGLSGSASVDHQAIASVSYLLRPDAERTPALDREHGLRLMALGAASRQLEEAVMYSGLASMLLISAGERELGRHAAGRAIALADKQDVVDLDIALTMMALLEVEAGERAAARGHLERAIAMQRGRPDPDPILLGNALLLQGIERYQAGELAAALQSFDEAAAIAARDTGEDSAELDKVLPFWRGVTRRRAGHGGTDGAELLRLHAALAADPDVDVLLKPSMAQAAAALAR